MRSSSIKSIITVATIATLTLTALPAAARQNNTAPGTGSSRVNSAIATIKRVYTRFITPIANALPTIPIPAPENQTTTTTRTSRPTNQQ